MKEVTAYLSADGALHASEKSAKDKDDDLLGQELDGLLRLFKLDITRNQEYKALIGVMNNRAELEKSIRVILQILDHKDTEQE